MSSKNKEIVCKENAVQAIVVADTFGDEFVPVSDTIPLALLPILNRPLVDYTLEFLSLGGIEETFLFCCTHVESIREHIDKCIRNMDGWTVTMKVNIIASESCHSLGDCLRDLDAKGLLRGDFVLIEPGTISNVQLLPLLKRHSETTKNDKYAAMTLVLQEAGVGYIGRCPEEEMLVLVDPDKRILFHKKLGKIREKNIKFPLDILLDNPCLSLHYNMKDTHIAICSPSVLPLFSDNFDFQSKDDLIKGLLMNEEILEGTVYINVLKGSQCGGAVTNWRMYQALSHELKNNWMYPLCPPRKKNRTLKNDVIIGQDTTIHESANLQRTVLGDNIKVGPNVTIKDSFILSNTKLEGNVTISHSLIGPWCTIKSKSKVTGSILGEGSVVEKDIFVENTLVQATQPENYEEGDKLGSKAYRMRITAGEDEEADISALSSKFPHINVDVYQESESEEDAGFSESDEEELSDTLSQAPDDTKMFFTEVIDSLTRGFDDNLLCDNLILEINSSRYAYNVTVKEVNFNVVKAILIMSLRQPTGVQYFSHLSRLLSFFAPILKNYIRNESAMEDCLQAIEDVAISNEELKEKWVMFVLQYLYNKDYVTEDAILKWYGTLDKKEKFHSQVKPFTDWLEQAEEASSSEEDSSD
ncbi:eukaryotic translation initiation factor 2B subunit epsilon isoform X1 [Leptinotarsa decemlineata]|uniref:eukaryotic translation initiation factor 2B subunit epsilon isoform X1 n=1 Tax=Leptinotarsa decemlineata TaxID=7539 RepID=UPI003D30A45E